MECNMGKEERIILRNEVIQNALSPRTQALKITTQELIITKFYPFLPHPYYIPPLSGSLLYNTHPPFSLPSTFSL